MNDPTAKSDQPQMDIVEAELHKSKYETTRSNSAIEYNAERIRSSLARLSSSSIDELQALTAELKKMEDFLKSEVDSIHRQIEGALAGINIIIETIAPWKNSSPSAPTMNARAFRVGPAAGIDVAPARRAAES